MKLNDIQLNGIRQKWAPTYFEELNFSKLVSSSTILLHFFSYELIVLQKLLK